MPEHLLVPPEMETTFYDETTKRTGNATQQLGWELGIDAINIYKALFDGAVTKE